MLKQQKQNVLDEVEVCTLLNITINTDGKIFANGKDENVKGCKVGAIRAVGIGSILKKNSDAVEVKNLQEINL